MTTFNLKYFNHSVSKRFSLSILSLIILGYFMMSCDSESVLRSAQEAGEPVEAGTIITFPPTFDAEPPLSGGLQMDSGQFGDPCEADGDCFSGYCVSVGGQRVCTELCNDDADCETPFVCNLLTNNGTDTTRLCVPDEPDLCEPCETDTDCDDPEDLCLEIGRGRYCSEDCSRRPCPDGFICSDVVGPAGQTLRQCLPESGLCAGCLDEDGDGYGEGADCLGLDCDETDPNTHLDALESCDGFDNDCDFQVDEDLSLPDDLCVFEGLCSDARPACLEGMWNCRYPTGVEGVGDQELSCDQLDNDCDGSIDEHVNFNLSAEHCGFCNNRCVFDNAIPSCLGGVCSIERCLEGWVDLNGIPADGCELACVYTSAEDLPDIDSIDSNCDGLDGVVEDGIFVDGYGGDDRNPGTRTEPMFSINAAIAKAVEEDKSSVFIAVAIYPEQVELVGGVNLYGGYDSLNNWQRVRDQESLIFASHHALLAEGIIADTEVQRLSIQGLDAFTPGTSSVAIILSNSLGVILKDNKIMSGRGAGGSPGAAGTPGTIGASGSDGQDAQDSANWFQSCDVRPGGTSGIRLCDDGEVSGGRGGDGGRSSSAGNGGLSGLFNPSNGGLGGIGGGSEKCDETHPGTNGGDGERGLDGISGLGGSGPSEVDGLDLSPVNGQAGSLGSSGGGGGGGGGGGSGGCRGTPGSGGQGGGSSVGILLIDSATFLDQNVIITEVGGSGGTGGSGGDGGVGGELGVGGPTSGEIGGGGHGGRGGDGGRGGHGGGGRGGLSVGVYRSGNSGVDTFRNSFILGAGGMGGQSLGNPGEHGVSEQIY